MDSEEKLLSGPETRKSGNSICPQGKRRRSRSRRQRKGRSLSEGISEDSVKDSAFTAEEQPSDISNQPLDKRIGISGMEVLSRSELLQHEYGENESNNKIAEVNSVANTKSEISQHPNQRIRGGERKRRTSDDDVGSYLDDSNTYPPSKLPRENENSDDNLKVKNRLIKILWITPI